MLTLLRPSKLTVALGCLCAAALLSLTGCDTASSGSADAPDADAADSIAGDAIAPAESEYLASDKARLTAADAPPADVLAVAQANTSFGLDLYGVLAKQPGNLLYSPYSISLALAMVWGGAVGQTADQIADTFHWALPQAQVHPALNTLDLTLESRAEGKQGSDGGKFRLKIANALWGQKNYPFLPAFLDLLALNYGAGMHVVDFIAATEAARLTINAWVEEKTEGKIKNLIPEGAVTSDTKLVLTNAIYFNAAWATPFEVKSTQPGDFTRLDGSKVTAQRMNGSAEMLYGKGQGWQAVAIPYDGQQLDMVLVVPDAGQFAAFEAGLSEASLAQVVESLGNTEVILTLPKFEFTSTSGLANALKELGMPAAFDAAQADFSGIADPNSLYIADVLHKAFIKVNEAGTEAAAATAVIFNDTAAVPDPPMLVVDRPFLFMIRDRATQTVLFIGRVVDPTAN
ncbi:MAG: serpin family protein [Myxococcota bacterium]